ncbi:MAG: alpha/beta fold hydrolase [Blastocatellia bacterium]|nr:alpha/beta fold hydrolase [Blastocatellia bacterium]
MKKDLLEKKRSISKSTLKEIFLQTQQKPFFPHPRYKQPHLMTLAGHFWPRDKSITETTQERIFQIDEEAKVLAHCHWQENYTQKPTIVMAHGLEGSSQTHYMIGTAIKASKMGFNVLRVNQRGGGGTHYLSPSAYHPGLSDDLRAIIKELTTVDKLQTIYLLGFSMGGNQSLKLAGEYANEFPLELKGICAISPPIDLEMVTKALNNPKNYFFQANFLRVLHRSLRRYHRHYPTRYDISKEWKAFTLRRFEELFTAPCNGFSSVEEYYHLASSKRLINKIKIPTLVIHAQDDPFIPFQMFEKASFSATTSLLAPQYGGHMGFLRGEVDEEDRYWAENRALDFFKLLEQENKEETDF